MLLYDYIPSALHSEYTLMSLNKKMHIDFEKPIIASNSFLKLLTKNLCKIWNYCNQLSAIEKRILLSILWDLQLWTFTYIWLQNKPYENEVILREKKDL